MISVSAQRPDLGRTSETQGIDLAHSSSLETTSSRHYNHTMFSTAPGTSGQRWTVTPRNAPHFHPAMQPYSFGVGEPRGREKGLDRFYSNALEQSTVGYSLKSTPRRYANAFANAPTREPLAPWNELGPGSYSPHRDCACGGVRVGRELDRPSPWGAPRVGGKWAHVADHRW